jgi:hypothetical protein
MTGTVFTEIYPAPAWNRREILRYASCGGADERTLSLMEECLAEIEPQLSYRVCFARFPVKREGDGIDLGFARVRSRGLAKNLDACDEIVLFAATVGLAPDRLTARFAGVSPAKALFFDAIGAERIEALCDAFCASLREKEAERGGFTRPRFSPGYGDLPLGLQREIFRALLPERHIGAALRESLIVSPAKTVTAIVGIGKNK